MYFLYQASAIILQLDGINVNDVQQHLLFLIRLEYHLMKSKDVRVWNLIKIQCPVCVVLAIQSQHKFAHITAALLSWHVQNFVVIQLPNLSNYQSILGAFQLRMFQVCSETYPGSHFTTGFSCKIQIWRKICFDVIPFIVIRSLQNFTHGMAAQLPCHVQNFVVIPELEFEWDQNKISIWFELLWKTLGEMDARLFHSFMALSHLK